MKKIFLGILMPLLCLTALIGTGFATWYFDSTTTDTNVQATTNLSIEAYAKVGSIAVTPQTATINFDQPGQLQPGGSYADLTQGITIKNASVAEDIKATYTPDATNAKNLNGNLVVTITIPAELKTYVKLGTGYTETGVDTGVWTKEVALNTSGETVLTVGNQDFDYTVSCPKNETEYQTFAGIIKSAKITVEFKAHITGQAAA